MEGWNLNRLTHEIPVKRFEMTEIENCPVPLGDRSVMEGSRPNQVE
jgi:hypothetical protein